MFEAGLDEAARAEDAERAGVEGAHGRVDLGGEAEGVVPARELLDRLDERRLARLEVRCSESGGERRADGGVGIESAEGGAEPLAVRRIAALLQEGEPHQVAHQACREHTRAELVVDLGRPPDERFLLVDPPPLAREQPQPQLIRIPAQAPAHGLELAEPVVEHLAGGHLEQQLLRRAEPVAVRERLARVEAEPLLEPGAELDDLDVLRHRVVVPAEANRPAAVLLGQLCVELRV